MTLSPPCTLSNELLHFHLSVLRADGKRPPLSFPVPPSVYSKSNFQQLLQMVSPAEMSHAFTHVFLFLFVVDALVCFQIIVLIIPRITLHSCCLTHSCFDLHHMACDINMHSPMFLCIHVKNKQQHRHKCLSKS